MSKEIDTVERSFHAINKALKTGEFQKRELVFIKDMSGIIARSVNKVLKKIPTSQKEKGLMIAAKHDQNGAKIK